MRNGKEDAVRDAATPIVRHGYSFGDSCIEAWERAPVGDGAATLFFLHGRFGDSVIWDGLSQRLSSSFRCVCPDFAGFGRSFSSRERGLSLLEHAEVCQLLMDRLLAPGAKAVLVGHDTGGAVAELCAVRDPDRVAGLVLINSSCVTGSPGFKTGWLGVGARLKLQRLLKEASVDGGISLENVRAPWRRHASRQPLIRALKAMEETWPAFYERAFWRQELRNLKSPVLLLWGKWDSLNPPSRALELMKLFREADLFQEDACGHWPCLEDPAWAAMKIREFVFRLGYAVSPVRRALSR